MRSSPEGADGARLAIVAACALLVVVSGCSAEPVLFAPRDLVCLDGESPPCETSVPARDEETRRVVPTNEVDALTLTFVVSALSMPPADPAGGGPAVGFNLDAFDSGDGERGEDCQSSAWDYDADVDADHPGVDNRLQLLVATAEGVLANEEGRETPECEGCLDARIQQALATGQSAILLELSDVDSLRFDPHVTVHVHEAQAETTPTLEDGRLAPNQRFRATRTLAGPAVGDIFEGRLRVRVPALALPDWPELGAGRLIWPTSSTDAELRFDVSADALRRGRLGGAADVELFATVFNEVFGGIEPGFPTDHVADLDPLPESPEQCARVSFGLALEAVAAERID